MTAESDRATDGRETTDGKEQTDGSETTDETVTADKRGTADGPTPTDDRTPTAGREATAGGPVAAIRGALGFLTRLPVGGSEAAWTAFRGSPWAFPAAGYPVGVVVGLVAATAAVGLPRPTVALAALVVLYAVTGIVHLDGVADTGDAAVVHGDASDRLAVLKDTTVGVGAVAAVALVLVGVAGGLFAVAALPVRVALGVVLAAEVGAKLGMAAVAAFGVSPHEGLGSAFTTRSGPRAVAPAVAVAVPAGLVALPSLAGLTALVGATAAGLVVLRWASGLVGGANGDVFGATNEIGRVVGLHAGVIVWTFS